MVKATQKQQKQTSKKSSQNNETRAVNLDLPLWMLEALDKQADSLGISRKAMINVILGQTLLGKKTPGLDLTDRIDLAGLSKFLEQEWNSAADDEAFRDL